MLVVMFTAGLVSASGYCWFHPGRPQQQQLGGVQYFVVCMYVCMYVCIYIYISMDVGVPPNNGWGESGGISKRKFHPGKPNLTCPSLTCHK